ncbi:MAG: hypothetical protein KatS3mg113_0134 [Planctomycetaceae bacterium]|nr:MAG: hypothetical protein KatS3mg113_0134 [Planctomycetaceae bacterium]
MRRYLICLALWAGLYSAMNHPWSHAADQGWKLTWHDEFEGTQLDRSKWDFDIGNGFYSYTAHQWISGWGNDELQYYTRDPENAWVGDGMLHIRVLKESLHGCGYTSARLKTRGRDGRALFAQQYGRFEVRAKLPLGQGLWPAIWMLPATERYGGWAASGEIDILEARGQHPHEIVGSLHFGGAWPANTHVSTTYRLPKHTTIADFHTYAVEWDPGEIRWYVDDTCYATQNFWYASQTGGQPPQSERDLYPWPAPFDQPFYLILNVAVGGRFVGKPDAATPFPAEMLVDYVRVYERTQLPPLKPRGTGTFPFSKRQTSEGQDK